MDRIYTTLWNQYQDMFDVRKCLHGARITALNIDGIDSETYKDLSFLYEIAEILGREQAIDERDDYIRNLKSEVRKHYEL